MEPEYYLIRIWKQSGITQSYRPGKFNTQVSSYSTGIAIKNDYFVQVKYGDTTGLQYLINQIAYADSVLNLGQIQRIHVWHVVPDQPLDLNSLCLSFGVVATERVLLANPAGTADIQRKVVRVTNFATGATVTTNQDVALSARAVSDALDTPRQAPSIINAFYYRLELIRNRRVGKPQRMHYRYCVDFNDMSMDEKGNLLTQAGGQLTTTLFWRFRARYGLAQPWIIDGYFDDDNIFRLGDNPYSRPKINCITQNKQEARNHFVVGYLNGNHLSFLFQGGTGNIRRLAEFTYNNTINLYFDSTIPLSIMRDIETGFLDAIARMFILYNAQLNEQGLPDRLAARVLQILNSPSDQIVTDTTRYYHQGDLADFRNTFYNLVKFWAWLERYGADSTLLQEHYDQWPSSMFPPDYSEYFPDGYKSGEAVRQQYLKNERVNYFNQYFTTICSTYLRFSEIFSYVAHIIRPRRDVPNHIACPYFNVFSKRKMDSEIAAFRARGQGDQVVPGQFAGLYQGKTARVYKPDLEGAKNSAPVARIDNFRYFDCVRFDNRPFIMDDWNYYWSKQPPTPPPPPPPPAPPPLKKVIIWDHTIHPLTAEEEDEEAVNMLEDVETRSTVISDDLYDDVDGLLKLRGAGIPGNSNLNKSAINAVLDQINPNDNDGPGNDTNDYGWGAPPGYDGSFGQPPYAYA